MRDEDILIKEFEKIKKDLIAKHDELDLRSSGAWASSLQVLGRRLSVRLESFKYVLYMVRGRAPGKMPPIASIEKWIEDRNLMAQIEGNITASSLAFLIARKIGKLGTRNFRKGGNDLISSVITPERIQSIIDKVAMFNLKEFTSQMLKEVEEVAQIVNT